MPVNHVERGVEAHGAELDRDLARASRDLDGLDVRIKALRRNIQLITARFEVTGGDWRRSDDLPIEEYLGARYVTHHAQAPGLHRNGGRRRCSLAGLPSRDALGRRPRRLAGRRRRHGGRPFARRDIRRAIRRDIRA